MSEPEPLPDDLSDWVDLDREPPPIPETMQERILDGVERAVRVGGAPPPGAGPSPSGSGALLRWLGPFAAGTVFGVAVTLAVTWPDASEPPASHEHSAPRDSADEEPAAAVDPRDETLEVGLPVPREPVEPPPEPASVPRATSGATGGARPPGTESTGAMVPAPASDLSRELLLIDGARAALRRGQPAEAERILERHAAQFPDGQLAAERERLRTQLTPVER